MPDGGLRRVAGLRMTGIVAVGRGGFRGVRAASALAAAMVVGAGYGALPAHAAQATQQADDVGGAQAADQEDAAPVPAGAEAEPAPDASESPVGLDSEQPADELAQDQPAGTFTAPAGLILSYIKSANSADFERVMSRLGAALASSEDEQRRELVAGWRVYRSREPGPDGEVLYVWLIDPAVAGADYAVPELLGEELPDESQALFDAFSEAFGSGQALINLEPVNIGPDPPQ